MERLGPVAVDHVSQPRNPGRLPDADAEGRAENPPCGDVLILAVRLAEGRVSAARFLAEGCAATRAAGSLLTELVQGLGAADLAALTPEEVDEALGGLPEGRFHAAELAARVASQVASRMEAR
jgi:NifU-like protein involved in Fe-S cluster formation